VAVETPLQVTETLAQKTQVVVVLAATTTAHSLHLVQEVLE
jgi:hypothetical protein